MRRKTIFRVQTMTVPVGRLAVGVTCLVGVVALTGPSVFGAQVAMAAAHAAADSTVPAWLYPSAPPTPPGTPPVVFDSVQPVHLPRSRVAFVETRLHDLFYAPDWAPSLHPPAPAIVTHGRKPLVYACGYCHMPDGSGRPENASLAGLPAAYIVQQVADMKSHARTTAWTGGLWVPYDNMRKVAEAATDDEVAAAAQYFSRLKPRQRTRIIESDIIPRVRPVTGLYAVEASAHTEGLAGRLIEAPVDLARHDYRDPYIGYVAYVPKGSVARGKALTMTPMNDAKQVCGSCHGPALRGLGVVPPLAGRSPGYLVRQLVAFRSGARSTAASAPMQIVSQHLTLDDMIAVAAYAATLHQ